MDINEVSLPSEAFISRPEFINVSLDFSDPDRLFAERLNKCLVENARLTQEIESNKSLINKIGDLKNNNSLIVAKLVKSNEDLAKITAERDRLKEEVDLGITKQNYLEILGTLAIKGCGIDIHAKKIKGIPKIIENMNLLGLSSDHKTVSKWLKKAAVAIEEAEEHHSSKVI